MLDHVGIVVKDLKRSASLYAHMLAPLGFRILERHKTGPGQGGSSPIHLCFRAPSQAAVDSFHRAGLAQGSRCNGAPGVRRQPFYCAFLIDPDGNDVEAGCYLT